jgi:hypothetical protein
VKKYKSLTYLQPMFGACMLFQVLYVLCVALWLVAPGLKGHAILVTLFPDFQFLDVPHFIYGLIASGVYGWAAAGIFVFFYNLWPRFAALIFGKKFASE